MLFCRKKNGKRKVQGVPHHKPLPFPDPKRKRKPTNLNKHKPNKRTKSTKISSLFSKRGNRNTKTTEKHKNKTTHGKTYNKSPYSVYILDITYTWHRICCNKMGICFLCLMTLKSIPLISQINENPISTVTLFLKTNVSDSFTVILL